MNIIKKLECCFADLKQLFVSNLIYFVIFIATFIVGIVLGFIFNDTIISAKWLFFANGEGDLFILKEKVFFSYLLKIFGIYLKTIICLLLLSLPKNFRWAMFALSLIKGISFALLLVSIFSSLGIIGIGYIVFSLILYFTFVILIFISFCYCKANEDCSFIPSKYTILCLTRFYIIMTFIALVFSLIFTLLAFLTMKVLFSIG